MRNTQHTYGVKRSHTRDCLTVYVGSEMFFILNVGMMVAGHGKQETAIVRRYEVCAMGIQLDKQMPRMSCNSQIG